MSPLRRFLSLCLALSVLPGCSCPSAELSEQASEREYVLKQFKVSRVRQQHLLLLPVEIQGREYPFVLDTGASITTFDTSLRSSLSETAQSTTVHTPDGDFNSTTYSAPTAKIGHFNLPSNSPVLCMDLAKFREMLGEEIYGVLGMDFLGKHVFRIDFDRGEVTFLRSTGSGSGIRIPVTFHNGVPQIQVTIPGLPEHETFQLDTGSGGNVDGDLRAEVFDALADRGILKLVGDSKSESLSGSGIAKAGRLEDISLGHLRHNQLLFCRSNKASFLSINYLSRYIVTFDFPNGAIYLKKGLQFDRR